MPAPTRRCSVRRRSRSLCSTGMSPEAQARDRLLALAIDARARGVAIRRAKYFPQTMRAEWTRGLLATPPWRTDVGESVVAALRVGVVSELSNATWAQGVVPVVPAIFRSNAVELLDHRALTRLELGEHAQRLVVA